MLATIAQTRNWSNVLCSDCLERLGIGNRWITLACVSNFLLVLRSKGVVQTVGFTSIGIAQFHQMAYSSLPYL